MSSDSVLPDPDGELAARQEEATSEVQRAAQTIEALAIARDARVRADMVAGVRYGPRPAGPDAVQVRQSRGLLVGIDAYPQSDGPPPLLLPDLPGAAHNSARSVLAAITESLERVDLAPRKHDTLTPYRFRSPARANRTRCASRNRERFLPGEEQEYFERASRLIRKARVPVAFAAFDPRRGDNLQEDCSHLIVWCLEHDVNPHTGKSTVPCRSWPERRGALERYGVVWAHEPDAPKRYNDLRKTTNREWHDTLARVLHDPDEWPFFDFKDEEDAAQMRRAVSNLLDRDRSL